MNQKMTRNAKMLQRHLVDKGLIEPEPIAIRRTRAGRHQLAAGAWSFYFEPLYNPGLELGGSCWTVTEVLEAIRKECLSVSRNGQLLELVCDSRATS